MSSRAKTKAVDAPTLNLDVQQQPQTAQLPAVSKPSRKTAAAAAPVAPAAASVGMSAAQMIGMLVEASKSSDFDIVKTREIADLVLALQSREESKAFDAAMLVCQAEIDDIVIRKDAYNKHTKSWWARLETISAAIDPVIRRHGFTISYGMAPPRIADHYLVVAEVSHRSGHVRRYEADIGNDSQGAKGGGTKSLAQGSVSSITFSRRALKCMIWDVKIAKQDNDGNRAPDDDEDGGGEPTPARRRGNQGGPRTRDDAQPVVTQDQVEKLVEALQDDAKIRERFLSHYGIDKLGQLPANMFDDAMTAIKNEIDKAAGK